MLYRFAEFELDTQLQRIRYEGRAVELTAQVYRALHLLVRRAPGLVSKAELSREVWPDAVVGDAAVSQCIHRVRSALAGPSRGDSLVQLVWGRGYRLAVEVTIERPSAMLDGFDARPAVVVLPFLDEESDPRRRLFADGLTDDLTHRLASWRFFPVIARGSAHAYRETPLEPARIQAELGARYAIYGRVRHEGDRVRVHAEAIDTQTGRVVCSERYDGDWVELFALQDEVAELFAAAIEPELRRIEIERVLRRDPEDLDAWDAFLRGLWHHFRYTAEDGPQARDWFARSVEMDGSFATPLAFTALSHLNDSHAGWSTDVGASVRAAIEAARQAVALDGREFHAHGVLGGMYIVLGERASAIDELELAVAQNPSSPMTYWGLGRARTIWGDPERAVGLFERALRLSPRDPMVSHFLEGLGFAHFASGDMRAAGRAAERSVALRPEWPRTHQLLSAVHAELGSLGAARAALARARELQPDLTMEALEASYAQADAESTFVERYTAALRLAGWTDPD
ncbi:MAG: winged helix-turn-helix domain-containing protein [Myxococcota bacterium]